MHLRAALILPMNATLNLRPLSDSGRVPTESVWCAPTEESMCGHSSDDSRGALGSQEGAGFGLGSGGIADVHPRGGRHSHGMVALVQRCVTHDVGDARYPDAGSASEVQHNKSRSCTTGSRTGGLGRAKPSPTRG
eukprot:7004336-Prymnesium_polylepis.1